MQSRIYCTKFLVISTLNCYFSYLKHIINLCFRFLLKDELIVVQTEDDLKKILEDSKGKQNVILTNVKEIGMKGAGKNLNE